MMMRRLSVCAGPLVFLSSAWTLSLVAPPQSVRNAYFCVRHGQSTANVANVISSCPLVGSTAHELTAVGRDQARAAGEDLWRGLGDAGLTLDRVALYSSNFTRARETKELVAFELQRRWQRETGQFDSQVRIGLLEALRERDFGALDGANTGAYDVVWPRDKVNPLESPGDGVEAVADVCKRLRDMVDVLEDRHDGDAIALVAHADVIQIFQTWFADAQVENFSSYRFKNGEVRRCHLCDPTSLPEPTPMVSQAGIAA